MDFEIEKQSDYSEFESSMQSLLVHDEKFLIRLAYG
jgi:hypothetical protein